MTDQQIDQAMHAVELMVDAHRVKARYELWLADRAGDPSIVERFDSLDDALDLRDALNHANHVKTNRGRYVYGVLDGEDPEAGWLERSET